MKKLYMFLLLFTGIVNAQIITIPDPFFKSKLLSANTTNYVAQNAGGFSIVVDVNGDGEIEQSEVLPIQTLTVSLSNISSLDGIQTFSNLKYLYADNMQMVTMNIALPTSLILINVSHNPLTSMTVTGLWNLQTLICNWCQLGTLDLSGCTWLSQVNASNNNLTAVNVSGMTSLVGLDLGFNQLVSLNVTGCTNIDVLLCGFNQLTTLDVSTLSAMTGLICSVNLLTTLDASNNLFLTTLNCESNSLQTLFIKNGSNENLEFGNNNNLHYICADASQISAIMANINYNTGITLNGYCSVPPGGLYNTITGSIIYDGNNNGCDAGDTPQPFIKVKINDGSVDSATFISAAGNYIFYTPAGNYTVVPDVENPSLFNVSPVNAVVNFSATNNSIVTQNFCVTANGVHPDVEVVLVPIVWARPGFDAKYKLVYKNKGNQLLSGTVNLTFDDTRTDFVLSTPAVDVQGIGSLSWLYTNLSPFETRVIYFTLHINSPTDTPPVNAGDTLNFSTTVTPTAGDETVEDNEFGFA